MTALPPELRTHRISVIFRIALVFRKTAVTLNPTIFITILAGPTVPEPATLTLFGIAIVGMAGYGWWRRNLAAA